MPEFNLNNKVRVKLTKLGHARLAADHAEFWSKAGHSVTYIAPKEDSEGWSEWQLRDLMKSLGRHIGLGWDNVMETTIQFEPFSNQASYNIASTKD